MQLGRMPNTLSTASFYTVVLVDSIGSETGITAMKKRWPMVDNIGHIKMIARIIE